MKKQWIAIAVLAVGLSGFWLFLSESGAAAFSPQLGLAPLRGKVVGVDAGHGGYDGGCVGVSGVAEKDLTLEVALLVREELEARGATVILSRDEDIALIDPKNTPGYKKRKELDNRLRLFEEGGAMCMVSIHMNKYRDPVQRGAQVFYRGDEADGQDLALAMQERLCALDPDYARSASSGDYYILNACPASVLVECGFLSNREEEQLLRSRDYQRKLARAIAEGVVTYFAPPPATSQPSLQATAG